MSSDKHDENLSAKLLDIYLDRATQAHGLMAVYKAGQASVSSTQRSMHEQPMLDLLVEFGWSDFSSRPPCCYLQDVIDRMRKAESAVSATRRTELSEQLRRQDPHDTDEVIKLMNAAADALERQ